MVGLDVVCVYTDGSGTRVAGLPRASYGAHFPSRPHLDWSAALPGRVQSAQRAEVMAVCKAIELSPGPTRVVTDRQHVCIVMRRLPAGRIPTANADLWAYILPHFPGSFL